MQLSGSSVGEVRTRVRCYGVCGKPGYNACTCQEVVEASNSAASNVIIVSSQCCGVVIKDSCYKVARSAALAYLRRSLICGARLSNTLPDGQI